MPCDLVLLGASLDFATMDAPTWIFQVVGDLARTCFVLSTMTVAVFSTVVDPQTWNEAVVWAVRHALVVSSMYYFGRRGSELGALAVCDLYY